MTEIIKLYDDSKCTACRGCQLACKQWNDLKAGQTDTTGNLSESSNFAAQYLYDYSLSGLRDFRKEM